MAINGRLSKNPLVSVIVPTIGRGTLARSLTSILRSSYPNLEIIIVSDKSNEAKIKAITSKFTISFIKLLARKPLTPAQAKNMGLKVATGKYVTFLDDDDVAYSEKFFALSKYLEANPGVFAVFGQYAVLDVHTGKIKNSPCGGNGEVSFKTLIKANYIGSGSIMLRNSPKVRFPENKVFGEDYSLWLSLIMKYKFAFTKKLVYGWTQNTKDGFTANPKYKNWKRLVKQTQQEAIRKWQKLTSRREQ